MVFQHHPAQQPRACHQRHAQQAVGLVSPRQRLADAGGPLLDARLYLDAHPRPGLWLPNGCMATGGSAIRWFQRELAGGAPLPELDAEAAATPAGADGLVLLPYMLGEKTPLNDPEAAGALLGLGLRHTREIGRAHV